MAENKDKKQDTASNYSLGRALIIGAVGGFLWSLFLAVSYFFNLTEVAPKTFLLKPWIQAGWSDRLVGHIVAIIIASILSLFPAVIYFGLFRKVNSIWMGVGYGILLWGITFFLMQPLLPYTRPMTDLSLETWVTTVCIFILYGLFTGYSISYDYHETKIRKIRQEPES